MKKLLPIMIAIAMLTVCLVSLDTDDTDAADIDIGFWVNNEKISKDADASGNGWKYEKATNTLILTGGTFSTNHDDTYNFGDPFFGSYQRSSPIYYGYDDTLKIVLKGENTISGFGPDEGVEHCRNGIFVVGNLEISGDGALHISGPGSNGILVGGTIRIDGGLITIGGMSAFSIWASDSGLPSSFTMTDGRLYLADEYDPSNDKASIYSDGDFTMTGGSIQISGVIRGLNDPFKIIGGIIKDDSRKAGYMFIEFGSLDYAESPLVNLNNVPSALTDNRKLVAIDDGKVSVGSEPLTKYVILDANKGSCEKYSVKTGDDGKLASPPDATREGYTFDGWYTAADGGDKIDSTKVFTEDTTIYAHWSKTGGGSDNLTLIIIGAVTGILVIGVVAIVLIGRKH